MGIKLEVFQKDTLAAQGTITVDQAILWLVDALHPNRLANGFSPSVRTIERNNVVLDCSYFTVSRMTGVVEVDNFDYFEPYGWTYVLTGTPEWHDNLYHTRGVTNDFGKLENLIWTYAKAWGQDYPEELGQVVDQLIALEGQPV